MVGLLVAGGLNRMAFASHPKRHRRRIGAACFKTSTPIRSRRFSRSSSMMRFCSGVRLSTACGDPDPFIAFTYLSTVLLHRSYPRITSDLKYRQKNVSGYAINHQFKYGNSSF